MIKLVSFVVFLVAFIWTWSLFNSPSKISVSVHAGLQSKLGSFIEEAVKKTYPLSSQFMIQSLTTETLDENKISARFSYSYMDSIGETEKIEQTVQGVAILNRSPSENVDDQKWIVQSVKTDQSQIEFQEGLVIGAGPTPEAEPTPEAPAAAEPAQTH